MRATTLPNVRASRSRHSAVPGAARAAFWIVAVLVGWVWLAVGLLGTYAMRGW